MCIYMWHVYIYIYMYIHVLRYHRFVFESSQCANGLSASGSTCTTWRSPASIASNSWFGKSQRSATQCGSKYMAQKKNIYIFIDIYVVKMFAIVWNIVYIHKYTQNCTKLWQNCSKLWL